MKKAKAAYVRAEAKIECIGRKEKPHLPGLARSPEALPDAVGSRRVYHMASG
jgi:hypothetical protein